MALWCLVDFFDSLVGKTDFLLLAKTMIDMELMLLNPNMATEMLYHPPL